MKIQLKALQKGLATLLLLVIGVPGNGLAEEIPAPEVLSDCGPLWLEGAETRIRTTLTGGTQTFIEGKAHVTVNMQSFGNPKDTQTLHAAVFRCIPGFPEGTLEKVPARVVQEPNITKEVLWELPKKLSPFQEERYHIYLSKKDSLGDDDAQESPAEEAWGLNLIPNAGFEAVNPADPSNPIGWYLQGESVKGNFKVLSVLDSHAALDGTRGVRLQVVGPTAAGGVPPSPRISSAETIAIAEGKTYHLRTEAWIRSATGIGLRVELRFRDAAGKRVGKPIIVESLPAQTTSTFEPFEAWGSAPMTAVSGQIQITTRGNVGVTDLDNISLELNGLEGPAQPLSINTKMEEGARIAEPLVLHPGGRALLFDLGPKGAPLGAGFHAIHPEQVWSDEALSGWTTEAIPRAHSQAIPEALSSDGIGLPNAPLRIQWKNGKTWVWVLLGQLKGAPPGSSENPVLQIENETITPAPIPYRTVTYHLEREDDAVSELKNQRKSIFDSYVLPRFTQVIHEVDNTNDTFEIQCVAKKTCYVVAMGLFKDVDRERLNFAINAIHAQRKRSFETQWAVAEVGTLNPEKLEVTPGERERGFLPFIPETGASLSPDYVPSRAAVRQAMNGLNLEVAPGTRALGRVGVYPLKFRRQGQLSLAEPMTQIGDKIEGVDWHIRTTRFRATRPRSNSSAYVLTSDLAMETDSLGIRPGISRTIWIEAEIPASALPGDYVGALRIQAGRSRYVEIPLRVEILPFGLPSASHGHGTSIRSPDELNYSILRNVNAISYPITSALPNQLIPSMERFLQVLQEANNPVDRIFLTPELQVEQDRLEDWKSMLIILNETAKSRKWPTMVLVASAFREAGFSREVMAQLCTSKRWTCASLLNQNRPRRRDKSEEIELLSSQAFPHALGSQKARKKARKSRSKREKWLFDVGCGRLGKGVLPWAFSLDGTLCLSGKSGQTDLLDAWVPEATHPMDYLIYQNRVLETERFFLAQEGITDARFLVLLESVLEKGKRTLTRTTRREIAAFLKETRETLLNQQEFLLKDGVFQTWPLRSDFRDELVSLLKKAWNEAQKP